jgi:hypothetical protein
MSATLPYAHALTANKPFSRPYVEAPVAAAAVPLEPSPWGVIWRVGGLSWAGAAVLALLWLLPYEGTYMGGEWVASTLAHAVQDVFVFLLAAVAYRAAIALGWPANPSGRTRVVLINAALCLGVAAFADLANALATGFVDGHYDDMYDTLRKMAHLPYSHWVVGEWLRFYVPPYLLGLCAIALVLVARRHQRTALRAVELSRAYADARMAMLSAQLQPHFLFNSLHAIMGLIDESPRQASIMLARLGDFLRHALETSHSPWVDLATELAGLEAYLAVQEVRFSGGLNVAIDVSPQALELYVPALLLQPLAENAIEHGRTGSGATLAVRVAVTVLNERLCIAVHNSSSPLRAELAPADYGRGLANVSLRLRVAYGEDAHLRIAPDLNGGTTAVLDLPVRRTAQLAAVAS